jgi:hypothetical protein
VGSIVAGLSINRPLEVVHQGEVSVGDSCCRVSAAAVVAVVDRHAHLDGMMKLADDGKRNAKEKGGRFGRF